MKFFFDTETSGKADFNAPPTALNQPRLVQVAGILTTDECVEVSSINLLIKPDGFIIGKEATEVHGIPTEYALKFGIPVKGAVGIFVRMAQAASTLHAFNMPFDKLIMMAEILRIKGMPDPFSPVKLHCEMEAMTNICKLPGGYRGKFKWPKLQEAYEYCYKKQPEQSHDALADVRTMIAIHKWRTTTPVETPELVPA